MLDSPQENLFGLDISDRALRLVKLEKRGKKPLLVSYNEWEIPPQVITNGEVLQEQKMIEAIKSLVKNAKGRRINADNTIAVLPETKTFVKVIEIMLPKDQDELANLVKEEIKNHIPLDLDELYLDWQILKEKTAGLEILVGAAPKNIVDSYYSFLSKSGFAPTILEIEAAAIIRSLVPPEDNLPKILIDFGANRTGLILCDRQIPQFTASLPISGKKITETIAATLKLQPQEAEEAKIVCGLDPERCEGALLKILMTPFNAIAREIAKAIDFYETNFSDHRPIAEIIICGGGGNFANIDKVLAEKLKIPVKIGNPFLNIAQSSNLAIPPHRALSFTTAIGLALRAVQK